MTAVPATQISGATPSAPPASTTTPSQKSYLACCVEDLSPNTLAAYKKKATWYQRKAVITAVALTALAVVIFVFAATSFPTYTPLIGLGVMCLTFWVGASVQKDVKASAAVKERIALFNEIKACYDALQQQNPTDRLNPIRAKIRYLDNRIQTLTAEKNKYLAESKQPGEAGGLGPLLHALDTENHLLNTKVAAAFHRAVLVRSDFNGMLKDIVDRPSFFETLECACSRALDDPRPYITFKNRSDLPAITFEELKRLSVEELEARILPAMQPIPAQ